jgi:peptidyl-prolyl cis-trans isomerase D
MLEAIRERSKGWLAKTILALITVPFALWGIESYLQQAGSNVAVAKVDDDTITLQQYSNALQGVRNQLQADGKVDPSVLESPALKQSVLDRLINNRLLNQEVKRAHFYIGDEQLSEFIVQMPEFQEAGKFSQEQYDQILTQNQLTPSQFESSLRGDLLIQQARDSLDSAVFVPKSLAKQRLAAEYQSREVSVAELKTADFIKQVKIEPEKIKAYYETHKDKFRTPEQVKLEFVLMSANTLISGMQVTDEEAKKFYAENAEKFQGDEQRRASHILISFGVSATPQAKEQAKKKAGEVLAEVKKNPAKFGELAKKYSQDPGSAERDGDLGQFGRGAMVKPFEDAVFSMKTGDVSELVESEFGYHIIKLTEITGASQTFESVKPQIRAELLYQKALAKFTEQAENFSNMVYEQSQTLEPASKAFGLQLQVSGWMSRADIAKFFKNDKLAEVIFTDEVLNERRNTEAIEVSPNNLMSARVIEHKPAAPRSFEEVKAGIEDFLKLEEASKLAQKKGEDALASLKQGKAVESLEWIPPVMVDRKDAQGLTELTMSEAFKADTSKLPAYVGVADSNKGYLLIRVSAVGAVLSDDEAGRQSAQREMEAALAAEYEAAYLKSLRNKTKVKINQQALRSDSANN